MNCYYCDTEPGPGGTRFGVKPAIGICTDCGVGVCASHAKKASDSDSLKCAAHSRVSIAREVADLAHARA